MNVDMRIWPMDILQEIDRPSARGWWDFWPPSWNFETFTFRSQQQQWRLGLACLKSAGLADALASIPTHKEHSVLVLIVLIIGTLLVDQKAFHFTSKIILYSLFVGLFLYRRGTYLALRLRGRDRLTMLTNFCRLANVVSNDNVTRKSPGNPLTPILQDHCQNNWKSNWCGLMQIFVFQII